MSNITDTNGLKVYSNNKEYSSATKELRRLYREECILIPYTLYYKPIVNKLPEDKRDLLDTYKRLTYDINSFKKNTAKCYDKHLVSYVKKLYKYKDEPNKLKIEIYDNIDGKLIPKDIYKKFTKEYCNDYPEDYIKYHKFIAKNFINHPVYLGSEQYYKNLEIRRNLKEEYTNLDLKILEICKKLWFKNYEKNQKKINKQAQEKFWILTKGLIINTINQLYKIDIPENIPEIVDDTIGRVYEGLMCFYDSNYKIDTFIYSITMSRISAYNRARLKKEEAPELFHNLDETDVIHNYYSFFNTGTYPILESSENIYLQRHKSWNTAFKELFLND